MLKKNAFNFTAIRIGLTIEKNNFKKDNKNVEENSGAQKSWKQLPMLQTFPGA